LATSCAFPLLLNQLSAEHKLLGGEGPAVDRGANRATSLQLSGARALVHQSWLELGDPGEDDQDHGPNW
jgi:hypothetical protein